MDDLLGKSQGPNSLANDKKKVKFEDDENDPLANLDFSDEDSQNSLDNANKQEQPIINSKKLTHLFGIDSGNQNNAEIENKSTEDPMKLATNETWKEDSTLNVSIEASLEKLIEHQQQQPQKSSSRESNLFGFSNNNATAKNTGNLAERNAGMKSIFSNDSQDMIASLGDKPRSATVSAQSKKSLMEDLFGREITGMSTDASKTKSTFSSSPSVTRMNTADSNTGSTNETASKLAPAASTGYSLSASKEPRRGRRSASGSRSATIQNDPFGYLSASALQFGDDPKPQEKPTDPLAVAAELPSKSPAVNEALPDWLGGSKSSKEQQDKTASTPSDLLPSAKSTENPRATSESKPSLPLSKDAGLDTSNLTSTLLGMEFNQQTAIMNMQQQEHELRTATALSRQTEKLNYLLETQKMKLGEQEKQFNALIAKQLERQTLIEAQIKAQQDRIDGYIQSLAAQPTTVPLVSAPLSVSTMTKSADDNKDDAVQSESLLHKVQLEKLYLENTLESLREKHDQEISILEESYKKQIAHLEEALVQMEKRAQDDIEALEADYRSKIERLKENLSDCEKARKEEKAILMEENSQAIREIQDRHRKNLEMLQKEHTEIIDKLTKSKESEREAIQVMRAEGTSVQNILNRSEFLIESLENLQKKFENKDKTFSDLQENHFSAHEKNIEYLNNLLASQKEAFDKEKEIFMTTTRKLESDISELTKEFQKQNASLQISEEILISKEQALLRDREIFVEQMNWERERLKAMMEAWAKEEDKQLEWLAQERQALAAERGKLQIFNRLKNQVDESSKIELEAAIKAAQEAAFSADQERVKWQEKMKELDKKQCILEQEEHLLVQKARELQEFTQSAIAKREEGLKALKEAHFIEQRYRDKFNQLHHQQEILIEKESKLAAEALELAKKRLSLHATQAEKPEQDKDENIYPEKQVVNHSDVPTTSTSDYTTYFKDIVDPHLVILKWDLENNLGLSQTTF